MNREPKPRAGGCLLWGGYAYGNTGDELTLAVAVEDMKRRFGEAVTILSPHPGYTMRLFPGLEVIPCKPVSAISRSTGAWQKLALRLGSGPSWRYRLQDQPATAESWLRRVQTCKTMYLVGGGYLTDLFSLFESLLLPIEAAKAAGVEIATAPLGLGPFHSTQAERKAMTALSGTDLVVRDQASLDLSVKAGIRARLVRDDGFRAREVVDFKPSPTRSSAARPRVGINVFDQYGSSRTGEARAWWIDFMRTLAKEPVDLTAFCFHADVFSDYSRAVETCVAAGLPASVVREPLVDFRGACAQLTDFDVIISARFHGVVVGNTIGKPTFAVHDGDYYKHKMLAATQDFERSEALDMAKVSATEAVGRVLEAARNPG